MSENGVTTNKRERGEEHGEPQDPTKRPNPENLAGRASKKIARPDSATLGLACGDKKKNLVRRIRSPDESTGDSGRMSDKKLSRLATGLWGDTLHVEVGVSPVLAASAILAGAANHVAGGAGDKEKPLPHLIFERMALSANALHEWSGTGLFLSLRRLTLHGSPELRASDLESALTGPRGGGDWDLLQLVDCRDTLSGWAGDRSEAMRCLHALVMCCRRLELVNHGLDPRDATSLRRAAAVVGCDLDAGGNPPCVCCSRSSVDSSPADKVCLNCGDPVHEVCSGLLPVKEEASAAAFEQQLSPSSSEFFAECRRVRLQREQEQQQAQQQQQPQQPVGVARRKSPPCCSSSGWAPSIKRPRLCSRCLAMRVWDSGKVAEHARSMRCELCIEGTGDGPLCLIECSSPGCPCAFHEACAVKSGASKSAVRDAVEKPDALFICPKCDAPERNARAPLLPARTQQRSHHHLVSPSSLK